jgi:hypothetical protein
MSAGETAMSDAYTDLAALRRQFGNWIIQAQDDNSAHGGLCLVAEPRLGRERGPYITRKTAPEMRAALAAEDGRRKREELADGTGPQQRFSVTYARRAGRIVGKITPRARAYSGLAPWPGA